MKTKLFRIASKSILAAATILACSNAVAAVTSFSLSNHPDSGTLTEDAPDTAPPIWGLRLDGLTNNSKNQIYVFDFNDSGSSMSLDYDDTAGTIHIYGTALGGEDYNSGLCVIPGYGCTDLDGNALNDSSEEYWDIDFTYTGVAATGDDGLLGNDELQDVFTNVGVTGHHSSFGTLTRTSNASGNPDYDLRNHSDTNDASGSSFVLKDSNTQDGLIGSRGWLDYLAYGDVSGDCDEQFDGAYGWCGSDQSEDGGATHPYTSDWLFIATPTVVPVPAAVWLMSSGLLGLIGIARRKA